MVSRLPNDNNSMDKIGEVESRPAGWRKVANSKKPTYQRHSILSRQWRPNPSEETEPAWAIVGIIIIAAIVISLFKQ